MKTKLLLLVLLNSILNYAQPTNTLYTIVTKYYPETNSSTIRLGSFNPLVGNVDNVGTTTIPRYMVINAGAINHSLNQFNIVTPNSLLSFNLSDGTITNEVPINSFHVGITNFTNIKYNTSSTELYGLASTFVGNYDFTGMYLSKLNIQTGVLTAVSQSSIGWGYSWSGCAINPEEMVYYYSTGYNFMGIDLYNGTNYSSPIITYNSANDYNFLNFNYNCVDDTIYGLVTEDTGLQDPSFPFPNTLKTMRLGKINPTTGLVTRVSETALPTSFTSLNASSTIDPAFDIFYYSDGSNVYGISTVTGLLVSTSSLNYQDGNQINYMTNYNSCADAVTTRLNSNLSTNNNEIKASIVVYPNPTNDVLNIVSEQKYQSISVTDVLGKEIKVNLIDEKKVDTSNLQSGVYYLNLKYNSGNKISKFVKL